MITALQWTHRKEYYTERKKDRLLRHPTKWVNLKNIMLRERSQMEKSTSHMTPFAFTKLF